MQVGLAYARYLWDPQLVCYVLISITLNVSIDSTLVNNPWWACDKGYVRGVCQWTCGQLMWSLTCFYYVHSVVCGLDQHMLGIYEIFNSYVKCWYTLRLVYLWTWPWQFYLGDRVISAVSVDMSTDMLFADISMDMFFLPCLQLESSWLARYETSNHIY